MFSFGKMKKKIQIIIGQQASMDALWVAEEYWTKYKLLILEMPNNNM